MSVTSACFFGFFFRHYSLRFHEQIRQHYQTLHNPGPYLNQNSLNAFLGAVIVRRSGSKFVDVGASNVCWYSMSVQINQSIGSFILCFQSLLFQFQHYLVGKVTGGGNELIEQDYVQTKTIFSETALTALLFQPAFLLYSISTLLQRCSTHT